MKYATNIMKLSKIIKSSIISVVSLSMLFCNFSIVAANNIVDFKIVSGEYESEILKIETTEENTQETLILENNELITIEYSENLNYVKVNGLIYSNDNYNKAVYDQAKSIYTDNVNISIVEALESYPVINDNKLFYSDKIKVSIPPISLNGITPLAEYGTYYKTGEYPSINYTAALTSASYSSLQAGLKAVIGGITGWAVGAAMAKSFITAFLKAIVKDYYTTKCYFMQWQAILNSGGTTRLRRLPGSKKPDGKVYYGTESHYYYLTYESQRPII